MRTIVFFFSKNRLSKIRFSNPFPQKTLRLSISKIRICIWSEESTLSVDFMDSWSAFGFAQKNVKSVFGFGNPDWDFPKSTHPKCRYFYLSVHVVVELSTNIMRGNWGFWWRPKNALLWQISRNQNLVGMDRSALDSTHQNHIDREGLRLTFGHLVTCYTNERCLRCFDVFASWGFAFLLLWA